MIEVAAELGEPTPPRHVRHRLRTPSDVLRTEVLARVAVAVESVAVVTHLRRPRASHSPSRASPGPGHTHPTRRTGDGPSDRHAGPEQPRGNLPDANVATCCGPPPPPRGHSVRESRVGSPSAPLLRDPPHVSEQVDRLPDLVLRQSEPAGEVPHVHRRRACLEHPFQLQVPGAPQPRSHPPTLLCSGRARRPTLDIDQGGRHPYSEDRLGRSVADVHARAKGSPFATHSIQAVTCSA